LQDLSGIQTIAQVQRHTDEQMSAYLRKPRVRGLFVFNRGNPVTFDGVELPLMDTQQEVLIELGSEENSYLTFESIYSKFWDVKYDPDFWDSEEQAAAARTERSEALRQMEHLIEVVNTVCKGKAWIEHCPDKGYILRQTNSHRKKKIAEFGSDGCYTDTVLLIDENPTTRQANRKAIAELDFRVLEASSIDEGRAIYEKQTPDMIVYDTGVAGGNGLEFCNEMLNRKLSITKLYIMLLFDGQTQADNVVCHESGYQINMPRSSSPELLAKRVDELLYRRRRAQADYKNQPQ